MCFFLLVQAQGSRSPPPAPKAVGELKRPLQLFFGEYSLSVLILSYSRSGMLRKNKVKYYQIKKFKNIQKTPRKKSKN